MIKSLQLDQTYKTFFWTHCLGLTELHTYSVDTD